MLKRIPVRWERSVALQSASLLPSQAQAASVVHEYDRLARPKTAPEIAAAGMLQFTSASGSVGEATASFSMNMGRAGGSKGAAWCFVDVDLRRALAARLPVGFGSDAAAIPHGDNAKEFSETVAHGESPMAGIVSATSPDAEITGWRDRVGFVMKGGPTYRDELAR